MPIGNKRVAGSLRTDGPNHEHRAGPNSYVIYRDLYAKTWRDMRATAGRAGNACVSCRKGPVAGATSGRGRAVPWAGPSWPGPAATAADGQLIRTLTPELVDSTRTSSARPEITASPNPAGDGQPAVEDVRGLAQSRRRPLRRRRPAIRPGWRPRSEHDRSTVTTNRSPESVISILTGSAGQCRRCTSTAREQASPTASRTSSSSASSTPLRRATAAATSRAVRTCAGSGVNVTSRWPSRGGLVGPDGVTSRPSWPRWPRPRCRGCRTPSSAR